MLLCDIDSDISLPAYCDCFQLRQVFHVRCAKIVEMSLYNSVGGTPAKPDNGNV